MTKRTSQYNTIADTIIELQGEIIVGGDWNGYENSAEDKQPTELPVRGPAAARQFKLMLAKTGLTYTYRVLHPEAKQYTFLNQITRVKTRLDRLYIDSDEVDRLHESKIIPNTFSDHDGYMISYMPRHRPVIQRKTGGTKSCRLNNQLLDDKRFKDKVEIILDQFEDECFDLDPTQAWDKTKKKVRNYAITRSIQLAKENKARLRGLYDRLSDPDIDEDEKKQVEDNIKTEHRKAHYGTYVRAKTEFDFELENTRAYYKREKLQGQSNRIDEVTTENGTETDETLIKTRVRDFYQTLYTRETLQEADMDHYCNVNIEPRDIDQVRTFLTVADIQSSIKESKNNKSPGPDGLTYEFYKHFSQLVTPILERVYLMVYTQGKMPISMCNSHVRLIYKNKGQRADLKNWRPISLSNTDYKIMTRCLAREMSKTLKDLVGENQVCGIPGCTIIDHLYTLYDMNEDGRTNNINMLAIDFEKAFDRVDHRSWKR